eukprot:Amastigsp_a513177_111.p2 type:complete len:136 gc:universal Amastigsp_a513177_111:347-754(+)
MRELPRSTTSDGADLPLNVASSADLYEAMSMARTSVWFETYATMIFESRLDVGSLYRSPTVERTGVANSTRCMNLLYGCGAHSQRKSFFLTAAQRKKFELSWPSRPTKMAWQLLVDARTDSADFVFDDESRALSS